MSKMVIVENKTEFNELEKNLYDKVVFAVPIFSSIKDNPVINAPSVLILQIFGDSTLYVLPFSHNDALSIPREWVSKLTPSRWITPYSRFLMHAFSEIQSPIVDFQSIQYLRGQMIDFDVLRPLTMSTIQSKFSNIKNVNKSIPLMTLMEYGQQVIDIMNYNMHSSKDYYNSALNNIILPVCHFIESSGIHVDEELFVKHFGEKSKNLIKNGLVYSWYNPYTAAGRVSNSWGGINFSALNKSDGSRECFTSRFPNGKMVLIDFESFHLRLAAKLMNYQLTDKPVHEMLAKQYFETDEITPELYDEGKKITFRHLYSDTRMKNPIPFFQAIYQYTDDIWKLINEKGLIYSILGRPVYLQNIDNPSPAKVFNYLLQLTETEVVFKSLYDLKPEYSNAKSKVVLYTYDSILIDWCPDDGEEILVKTIEVLEEDRTFPTRIYVGQNYHNMKKTAIESLIL
jgi:hypothetical protein